MSILKLGPLKGIVLSGGGACPKSYSNATGSIISSTILNLSPTVTTSGIGL